MEILEQIGKLVGGFGMVYLGALAAGYGLRRAFGRPEIKLIWDPKINVTTVHHTAPAPAAEVKP